MATIPPSVIGTASPILADAYTHAQLNALFMSAGFPGDAPDGNKIEKCRNWLRRANAECGDSLRMLGALIAEFMDAENTMWGTSAEGVDARERIRAALGKEGLTYSRGGHIHGAALSGPSLSLAQRIKAEGIPAIEIEYERAYKAIDSDPGAAVTAACAILESVCKSYLEAQGHALPSKQVLGALWPQVANHLGLSPKDVADDDLKRILQGLYSIGDGVAALRTHAGSAHGHAQGKSYRLAPRHARLAVHAAHTMALFVLETSEERRRRAPA
jgi:Abortive infection C-terminus